MFKICLCKINVTVGLHNLYIMVRKYCKIINKNNKYNAVLNKQQN